MSEISGQSYPQPHEGITGTLRDQDDLLSLEEKALPVRKAMMGLASALRSAVSVGQPAPVVERMSARMSAREPGDLVIETSTMYLDRESWPCAFGILLAHRVEWWQTDAEWAAQIEQARADHEAFLRGPYAQPGDADEPFDAEDSIGPRPTDHAWYVQYGPQPDDVYRWVNCAFMVVPTDRDFCAVQFGTRDGSGVTLTRNDVVGSLADSGFALRLP